MKNIPSKLLDSNQKLVLEGFKVRKPKGVKETGYEKNIMEERHCSIASGIEPAFTEK